MSPSGTGRRSGLLLPLGWSAALHASLVGFAFLSAGGRSPLTTAPVYRVNIIAAPPAPRAIGTVGAEPSAAKTPPVPTPVESAKPAAPKAAPPKAAGPRAGGGPVGDKGTDVATVRTEGIDFPFPGYLNNIVRQIALNFNPRDRNAALRSEVMFIIRRDGSVANIRILKKSGSYAFDLEAQGAVEAVSTALAFGPLPAGFLDDALTVYFSFDPKVIR